MRVSDLKRKEKRFSIASRFHRLKEGERKKHNQPRKGDDIFKDEFNDEEFLRTAHFS